MTTHKGGEPLHRQLSDDDFEPLTPEAQARISAELIAARRTGDEKARLKARDELIRTHLRLVQSIVKGYTHKLDPDDAFSVGVLALSEAMDRWDPSPGGMSAYQWAKRWITTALNKSLDASRQIRIPEQVAYKAALNTKIVKERENAIGRSLTPEEIEDLTGGGVRLEDLPIANVSIHEPLGNATGKEPLTVEDVTPDKAETMEETLERDDLYERVRRSLATLTQDERLVVEHRFGLNGAEGKTLSELGKILSTSGEAVRRLEASALAKLNHPANPLSIGDLL